MSPTTLKPFEVPKGSPFLAILGVGSISGDYQGVYYPDGLRWRIDPGQEVSRFAYQALQVFGERSPWAQVEAAARVALNSIDAIAEDLACRWRTEFKRPDMTARRVVETHGAADLLASARLWNDEPPPEYQVFDDGEIVSQPGTELLHKPPADDFDGHRVLAAFAMLMADHSVDASESGEHGAAMTFLALGGTALSHATMDKAQATQAKVHFDKSRDQLRARTRAGGLAKGSKLGSTKQALQAEYRAGRGTGKFKSANQAAIELQVRAMAMAREAGSPLSEHRAQKTLATWFREVDRES